MWNRWHPRPSCSRRHISRDAAAGADTSIFAHLNKRCDARLSGKHTPAADQNSASQPHLPHQYYVAAELCPVSHQYEIIQLAAASDHGIGERSSVDTRVRTNLDVILDSNATDLRHFDVPISFGGVAESVGPDDNTRLKTYARTDASIVQHHTTRREPSIFADLHPVIDVTMRHDSAASSEPRSTNDGERPDVHIRFKVRLRVHTGMGTDATGRRCFGIQRPKSIDETPIGIFQHQKGRCDLVRVIGRKLERTNQRPRTDFAEWGALQLTRVLHDAEVIGARLMKRTGPR